MELKDWLKQQMELRGIRSNRELVRKINEHLCKTGPGYPGMGHSTINRIMRGEKQVSLNTIMILASWAGVDTSTLIDATNPYREGEASSLEKFSLFVSAYPELEEDLMELVNALLEGRISPEEVRGVLATAASVIRTKFSSD